MADHGDEKRERSTDGESLARLLEDLRESQACETADAIRAEDVDVPDLDDLLAVQDGTADEATVRRVRSALDRSSQVRRTYAEMLRAEEEASRGAGATPLPADEEARLKKQAQQFVAESAEGNQGSEDESNPFDKPRDRGGLTWLIELLWRPRLAYALGIVALLALSFWILPDRGSTVSGGSIEGLIGGTLGDEDEEATLTVATKNDTQYIEFDVELPDNYVDVSELQLKIIDAGSVERSESPPCPVQTTKTTRYVSITLDIKELPCCVADVELRPSFEAPVIGARVRWGGEG